jgi:hypothetical protein
MPQEEKRTLAFGRFMSCLILVHSEAAPSDKDWKRYLEFVKQHIKSDSKIIVQGKGGPPPSAAQRAKLVEVVGKDGVPTAVLTDDPFARGVVTALNWVFGQKLAAFPSARLEDALSYLGVPAATAADIRKIIVNLSAELLSTKSP